MAAALDDERLADVLEELPEEDQVEILAGLDVERAADVLEEMAPDDAADLIAELPPERAEELLELMEPDEAEDVRRLLSYDEDTAGGMMTPEPVILGPDATIAEALAEVRRAELSPALACTVYVCRAAAGDAHRAGSSAWRTSSGCCASRRSTLGRRRPRQRHRAAARPTPPSTRCAAHLATYNLVGLPVVDEDGHLLGAVTVDDLLDHMLPENWRDRSATDVGDRRRRCAMAERRPRGPRLDQPREAPAPLLAAPVGVHRGDVRRASPSSSRASWAPPGS